MFEDSKHGVGQQHGLAQRVLSNWVTEMEKMHWKGALVGTHLGTIII